MDQVAPNNGVRLLFPAPKPRASTGQKRDPSQICHRGVNRVELDKRLLELGGTVKILRRSGDVQYSHPTQSRTHKGNCRRKDAPLALVAFVKRVERALGGV